jgi:hypothetical protein
VEEFGGGGGKREMQKRGKRTGWKNTRAGGGEESIRQLKG